MLDWQHSKGVETLMSVDEYLHTTFDGADREYLDGEWSNATWGTNLTEGYKGGSFVNRVLTRNAPGFM